MPASPIHERTSYIYDPKRDVVVLTIQGTPKQVVLLTQQAIEAAADCMNAGRQQSKTKATEIDSTVNLDVNTNTAESANTNP